MPGRHVLNEQLADSLGLNCFKRGSSWWATRADVQLVPLKLVSPLFVVRCAVTTMGAFIKAIHSPPGRPGIPNAKRMTHECFELQARGCQIQTTSAGMGKNLGNIFVVWLKLPTREQHIDQTIDQSNQLIPQSPRQSINDYINPFNQ